MKDLSLFLLKNSLGAKMKKGFRSFCNGDGSTSTLNQRKTDQLPMVDKATLGESPPTLEEMILQLELEEKMARKAKLDDDHEVKRRMSCVNNSDILRSARNALNQYPRFSLDGKDAMYRSSFRHLPPAGRKSVCCNYEELRKGLYENGLINSQVVVEKTRCLPAKLAGESVVWCKPGVVAKLMGLEAMPVPVAVNRKYYRKERLSAIIKKQHLMRRRAEERHDQVKTRRAGAVMDLNGCSTKY
uniref:DUF3741 domain-containing protein n=1 Tax=Davidia involucrata TaxID=16924 RepID=A0A5B7BR22_DAVIN